MPKNFKRVAYTDKAALTRLTQAKLKPVEEVAVERRPYASRGSSLIVGHEGLVYGPQGVFSNVGGGASMLYGDSLRDNAHGIPAATSVDHVNPPDEKRMAKNQRLWDRWNNEVIPNLMKPLLGLLRMTSMLRTVATVRGVSGCMGCGDGRLLGIFCIFFDRKSKCITPW